MSRSNYFLQTIGLILTLITLTGCSVIIEKKTQDISTSLTQSMLNFEDPQLVAEAMPTFIILLNAIAQEENASAGAKLSAAQLISAYTGAFVESIERQQKLSLLAFDYAKQGSCLTDKKWCNLDNLSAKKFPAFIESLNKKDALLTFQYASVWLSYINSHSHDWNAVANLQQCRLLLERVIELDAQIENGSAYVYLGAIDASIPAALGGNPEQARAHFEQAISISEGKNLVAKVELARRYARSTFNKSLHHRLLNEVISAESKVEGLTLMNTWAQQQAKALLATENDYFD